jgi:hypothetical protein
MRDAEQSSTFLKKRTKKLSLIWGAGICAANYSGPESANFFAAFFIEKAVLPCLAF